MIIGFCALAILVLAGAIYAKALYPQHPFMLADGPPRVVGNRIIVPVVFLDPTTGEESYTTDFSRPTDEWLNTEAGKRHSQLMEEHARQFSRGAAEAGWLRD